MFTVWAMFFRKQKELDPLVVGSVSGSNFASVADAKILGAEITQALVQIESLTLDKDVFSNAIYRSLRDRSKRIDIEPIGRRNPFAPLGDTSVNFTSSVSNVGSILPQNNSEPEESSATTTPQEPASGGQATSTPQTP